MDSNPMRPHPQRVQQVLRLFFGVPDARICGATGAPLLGRAGHPQFPPKNPYSRRPDNHLDSERHIFSPYVRLGFGVFISMNFRHQREGLLLGQWPCQQQSPFTTALTNWQIKHFGLDFHMSK
ncbi:hypothetical protein ACG0Z6_04895 [Roseateles sp. BYS180W]|uniref:Uncharacterized protein n=1 Tax=Roseateles rivi TaxID=3299028 RepID=A0ABW7FTC6_9BURK